MDSDDNWFMPNRIDDSDFPDNTHAAGTTPPACTFASGAWGPGACLTGSFSAAIAGTVADHVHVPTPRRGEWLHERPH
jgi:hypothetical protein